PVARTAEGDASRAHGAGDRHRVGPGAVGGVAEGDFVGVVINDGGAVIEVGRGVDVPGAIAAAVAFPVEDIAYGAANVQFDVVAVLNDGEGGVPCGAVN